MSDSAGFQKRFQYVAYMAGHSIRGLAKAAEEHDVPSSSEGNIRRILSGGSSPTIDFVQGMAAVLGVNAAWLAFGHGHQTLPCTDDGCIRKLERIRDIIEERP